MRLGHDKSVLVFDPAGYDAALRLALTELRVGRWMTMRDLLAETGDNWALRTSRSQVLASVAARTDVVTLWTREEPWNADALMMRARVASERLLIAHRRQPGRVGHGALVSARQVCESASQARPQDPVPWICLLAMAPLDRDHRMHQQAAPQDTMLPRGPWGLLQQVNGRHPGNREAHHRMLRFLQEDSAAVADYMAWLDTWVLPGSPLAVLPLHVYAARYPSARVTDRLARLKWQSAVLKGITERAWEDWFLLAPPDAKSPLDLNHLAHALYAGFELARADRVFQAIGPYATQWPWAHVDDRPQQAFLKAREHSAWTVLANIL